LNLLTTSGLLVALGAMRGAGHDGAGGPAAWRRLPGNCSQEMQVILKGSRQALAYSRELLVASR
jgi:hypothetical protein